MGATWFDEQRGTRSGRVEATDAPAGSRVFVLGALTGARPALVGPGAYAEVKQVVDLTGFDLVGATLDTVGQPTDPIQDPSGWPADDGAILRWQMATSAGLVPSEVAGGAPLAPAGDLAVDVETYSPEQRCCRAIPVGSTTATLGGQVAALPPDAPAPPLNAWTFEWWMTWVGWPTIPGSSGYHPAIIDFMAGIPGAGLRVYLSGAGGPGAHQWRVAVLQRDGIGGASSAPFSGYLLDGPLPWTLFSVVTDRTLPFPQYQKLYVNGAFASNIAAGPPVRLGIPAPGSPLLFAQPRLQSKVSAARLVPRALSAFEVAQSYVQCTTLPPAVPLDWWMELLIDGAVVASRVIPATERRRWQDFLAPCRQIAGPHEVAFRLSLQT